MQPYKLLGRASPVLGRPAGVAGDRFRQAQTHFPFERSMAPPGRRTKLGTD